MNIKEEFKKWLVQNGVAEKTSTGRPGAAYDYTRLIDKICDIIYKFIYEQLLERTKPKMVAITAIMRKMITCLNAKSKTLCA